MSNIKFKEVNAVAIIPAKGNSTRLPKKNFQMINDKSLVEYAIDYAKSSAYVKKIYVSTDSIEIKEIAEKNNVLSFERPKDLLGEAEVADIYVDLMKKIPNNGITHVIGLQPDHPDRQNKLDEMINYFIEKKYMDLFTVNKNGSRNGSVRIFKAENVLTGQMSRRVGSILDDCTNVENKWQLDLASKRILEGDYYEKN
tara:strand:+ start:3290 stop:3883 length:594 start_codon:yes stop_codon:yes gene_type:complete